MRALHAVLIAGNLSERAPLLVIPEG